MSHLGIFGMTGSGKSYYLKTKLIPAWNCVVAIDVNDELSKHGREKPSRPLGPLRERMTARELAKYPTKLLEPELSLAVVPTYPGLEHEAKTFDLVSRLLVRAAANGSFSREHNIKLVIDECGPYAKLVHERLTLLATRGVTHLDVDIVAITQRPNLLPLNVRANLDEILYFRLPEAADLDTVREKAGKEIALRVSRLPERRFITWRATGSTESPAPPQAALPEPKGAEQWQKEAPGS